MSLFNATRFVILSGAPGAGKTTLLLELQSRGASIKPELARLLIKEEVLRNGTALPWADSRLFANHLWEAEYRRWLSDSQLITSGSDDPSQTFYDRSWVDAWAYCQMQGVDVSVEMLRDLKMLATQSLVLVCSPWRAIYTQDTERKQSWNEALISHTRSVEAYRRFGFRLMEVPKMQVHERANWVQSLFSFA